jgi:uncharacterized protein (TIGR02646 family)
MIFINRNKKKEPEVLKKQPGTPATKEKEAAIAYYAAGKQEKSYEYTVYKNDEVRTTLEELFNGKCAYCEARIKTISHGDIEHYRPKSTVKKKKKQEGSAYIGYYWLAADWDNLLLSCELCNRKSSVVTADGKKISYGKLDQFPLKDEEQHRCTHHDEDVAKEAPYRLLLNPCIDDPGKHLVFKEDGIVQPAETTPGVESEMGRKSIDVYGLFRKELVEDRLRLAEDIKVDILNAKFIFDKLTEAILQNNAADVQQYDNLLNMNIKKLQRFLADEQPHLAVTRQLVEPALKQLNML